MVVEVIDAAEPSGGGPRNDRRYVGVQKKKTCEFCIFAKIQRFAERFTGEWYDLYLFVLHTDVSIRDSNPHWGEED